MSLIHESELFKLAYDMIKHMHTIGKKFSKGERYTLAARLETRLLDLLMEIVTAGTVKHEWKVAAIDRAIVHVEQAKILFRLAFDVQELNQKTYIAQSEQANKIGRMLGGWRKSV